MELRKKCIIILALILLLIPSCSSSTNTLEKSTLPSEDNEFDYADSQIYHISGSNLNTLAMDTYPQKIVDDSIKAVGTEISFDLLVKNQSYYDLDPISIEDIPSMDLPEDIICYLAPSSKVTWDGDDIKDIANSIAGNDLFSYVKNAVWYVNRIMSPDKELGRDVYSGLSDTLNSEDALAMGGGTCGEYCNVLLAVLRCKGIPSRMVVGTIYSDGPRMYHSWVEFYYLGFGWIPVDPSYGDVGVNDNYIKLDFGLDYPDIGVKLRDYRLTIEKVET